MENLKTFAGIEAEFAQKETAKIYLQSIPYDGTSTWGKGADKGFEAFMDAAENMELYDIETNTEVYKEGVHLLTEAPEFNTPEEMNEFTYRNTQELLKEGKFLTFFGGEHSISIGLIKAHYEHFENLTVLQIDAHADLRPSYDGTKYNHACAVYDASKHANLVQVGIRSMDISEKEHMNYDKVFFADEIKYNGVWEDQAMDQLTDNVYITFDLDAFDPSIMPATGTPEPGGLDWYLVTNFLARVFEERNVVGFDIVELAPIIGHKASEFLAAKLYYKMLSYKFS
ncbi:MAG: agmatinase [Saprospiraceae bacterium]|nr:agmatinase [Saprospiraceae bacterium]